MDICGVSNADPVFCFHSMNKSVSVQRTEMYAAACKEFLDAMHKLNRHGDPANIRSVFWFDQ